MLSHLTCTSIIVLEGVKAARNLLDALKDRQVGPAPSDNGVSSRELLKGVMGFVDQMGSTLALGLAEGGTGEVHTAGMSLAVSKRPDINTRYGGAEVGQLGDGEALQVC